MRNLKCTVNLVGALIEDEVRLSKDFIKKAVPPSNYIHRVDVPGIGIVTHIELQKNNLSGGKN